MSEETLNVFFPDPLRASLVFEPTTRTSLFADSISFIASLILVDLLSSAKFKSLKCLYIGEKFIFSPVLVFSRKSW